MAADDRLADGSGQGDPAADQPEHGESNDERKLFDTAVDEAVAAQEIAAVIVDYVNADAIRDGIRQKRAEIWAAVTAARSRFRDAQRQLRAAEQAATSSVLDPAEEANWDRQQREFDERWQAARAYADDKRLAQNRSDTEQTMRRVRELEALVKVAETAIDSEAVALVAPGSAAAPAQATAAAEPASAEHQGQPEQPPAGVQQRGLHRFRRSSPLPPAPDDQLRKDYDEALVRVQQVQRAYQDFLSARERRNRALEPVIKGAIRRDPGCSAARQARDAARENLSAELLQAGTLPMARAFVNRYVAALHRTSMRAPEESGLYDTFAQSVPVITREIRKVDEWLARMKGASIGIAGPRGAGKTTLIDFFCSPRVEPQPAAQPGGQFIQLRASAPVEYVPREFILYLLGELCCAILRLDAPDGLPSADSSPPPAAAPPGGDRKWWRDAAAIRRWLGIGLSLGPLLAAPVLAEIALLGTARLARGTIAVTSVSMLLLTVYCVLVWGTWVMPVLSADVDGLAVRSRPRRRYWLVPIGLAALPVAAIGALSLTGSRLDVTGLSGYAMAGWALAGAAAAVQIAALIMRARGRRLFHLDRPAPWPSPVVSAITAGLALVWLPVRPFLLVGGCVALGVSAVASLGAARAAEPGAGLVLRTLRNALALGGLVCCGLSWYPGRVNYVFCVALGLLAVGVLVTARATRLGQVRAMRRRANLPTGASLEPGPEPAAVPSARPGTPELSTGRQALARRAAQLLGYVEYAQTMTVDGSRKWTAGVGGQFPVSFEKSSASGLSWTRQPWSVPAAVEQFRDLLRQAAREHAGVIVGIDELDKLEYDKSATFLNDIKAIFGVPGGYFLVSVSENAAAGFERRGVPFRDVFDSSFDEIISVGYLSWPGARDLLNTRVVGMHAPFAVLCYLYSGGLARDLIRTARAVLSYADEDGNVLLADAVRQLCREEMLAKTHGIYRELANFTDDTYVMSLLAHVQASDESFEAASDYLEWSEYVGGWIKTAMGTPDIAANGGKAIRFARELAVFGYFTATVFEFFGERLDRERFERATQVTQAPSALRDVPGARIERLAKARQAMAVSPVVAERHIIGFRTDYPDWQVPRPVSATGP